MFIPANQTEVLEVATMRVTDLLHDAAAMPRTVGTVEIMRKLHAQLGELLVQDEPDAPLMQRWVELLGN